MSLLCLFLSQALVLTSSLYIQQKHAHVVWLHACGHWAFMVHPIQLEFEFLMTIPPYGLLLSAHPWEEEQTTAYSIKNAQSLTHLNVAPKGTSTPVRPLFSQHPIIYTVNTCPAPYRSRNHSNRVRYKPCSWQIYERRDGFNVLVKQEARSEEEERGGGAAIFSFVWKSIYWVAFGVMPDALVHRQAQSKLD